MLTKRMFLPVLATMACTYGANAYQIEPRLTATTAQAPTFSRAAVSTDVNQPAQVLQMGTPLTVDLADNSGGVLRTEFSGLNSGGGAPFIRVFANTPDADASAAQADPGYVGAVAFYPVPLDGTFTSILNVSRFAPITSITYVLSGDRDARVVVESAQLTSP